MTVYVTESNKAKGVWDIFSNGDLCGWYIHTGRVCVVYSHREGVCGTLSQGECMVYCHRKGVYGTLSQRGSMMYCHREVVRGTFSQEDLCCWYILIERVCVWCILTGRVVWYFVRERAWGYEGIILTRRVCWDIFSQGFFNDYNLFSFLN